jgi:hypothetical protein
MVASYSNWQLDLRALASQTPPPFDRKKIYTMEPWNYQLFYEDREFHNRFIKGEYFLISLLKNGYFPVDKLYNYASKIYSIVTLKRYNLSCV